MQVESNYWNKNKMKDVFVCNNPIVSNALTVVRDKTSTTENFRDALNTISAALVYEAARELTLEKKTIITPICEHDASVIKEQVVLIPILRAGMGMLNAALGFYKDARVGYIGVKRNEETMQPEPYYENLPLIDSESVVFILDPMLATGGSINYTLDIVKQRNCKKIVVLSVVGVMEGVNLIKKNHPDVIIYLGALDQGLNKSGYIIPGLGDCGDRLNKTE